jgi:hypothetical protein
MSTLKTVVTVPVTARFEQKSGLLRPVVIAPDKKIPLNTQKDNGASRSTTPRDWPTEVTLRNIWPNSVQIVASDNVYAVLQISDALWLNLTRDNDDVQMILTAPGVTRIIHDKILLFAAADGSVLIFEDGVNHTIQAYLPDEAHFTGTLSLNESQIILEAMGATVLLYDTKTALYSIGTALEHPPSDDCADVFKPLSIYDLDVTVMNASLSVDGQAVLCTVRVSNTVTGVYCLPLSSVVNEDKSGWHLLGEGDTETFMLMSDKVAMKYDTLKRVVYRMIIGRDAAPNTPFAVDEKSAPIANVVDCQVDATNTCVWIYTLTGNLHKATAFKTVKAVKTPDEWLTIDTHLSKTIIVSHGTKRQGHSFPREVMISKLIV